MPERLPLLAVGDTHTAAVPHGGVGAATVAHWALQSEGGAAVDAGAASVLEATINGVDWVVCKIKRVSSGALEDSLIGPNVTGWCDVPSARAFRVRCTVLPAGALAVTLRVQ